MKHFTSGLLLVLLLLNRPAAYAQDIPAQIDKLLSKELKANEPGGVVLIAQGNKVLFKKAYGMAHMELDVPMNDSMVFYIGSNTKQFTAVAILQLVEQGKLSLSDSIGKYISCPYPASSITINQLLSHTSGLGTNTETQEYKPGERKEAKREEIAAYFLSQPMAFAPAARWRYNNANYYILGYLIEKISGMPYDDYLHKYLFEPAGLLHTYMGKEALIVKNRVPGYLNFRAGVQNTRVGNARTLYASGGIQSTAEDMYQWNRALLAGKLLKPETLKLALTPQRLTDGSYTTYGLGWHLGELQGSPTIRHGGLVEGAASETLFLPKEDVYVVMLFNVESPLPVVALSRIAASMIINKPYSFTEVALPSKDLRKYVGLYRNQWDELVNITEEDDKLFFHRPGGTRYQIKHATEHQFFFDNNYIWVEFFMDSLNRVKELSFSQVGIGLTTWKKVGNLRVPLFPDRFPDSLLTQYVGAYVLPNNDTVILEKRVATLRLQLSGEKIPLVPTSIKSFSSIEGNLSVEFQTVNGQIDALLLSQGNRRKQAKRIK